MFFVASALSGDWIWIFIDHLLAAIPILILTIVILNRFLIQKLDTQSQALIDLHSILQSNAKVLQINARSCSLNSDILNQVQHQLTQEVLIHDKLQSSLDLLQKTLDLSVKSTNNILTMVEVVDKLMQKAYPEAARPRQ